ncbi:putative hydrolase of HD superfamily [Hoeflea phototrophica DFL-43]|jgi:putative hydrolase of HD superfamily|uniref:5'-deoxynucleotidase n=1 Tax=Hoeflea phototrophica (strain DSM 17068 / NCIMB 14078 / DFL-43) TaxID=411684 RepID=A9D3P3_HOEPD|nr:HD domain-containing protein [Hoeflea phototrophica]EDQ33711.1 putative hydrolase of HD superfamily [Hoeflea phototrophica DFL-43]
MTELPAISFERMSSVLAFLDEANRLKDTLRSGRTPQGRQESTAEHSWRLCLLAILLAGELKDVDLLRLLKICIVHDLGEAISGDVPATEQRAGDDRAERERADLITLCAPLPEDLRSEIVSLWDEYAQATSPEAIMAKGLDKIETMLTHSTGKNDDDFDYRFNLGYGLPATNCHPLLIALRQHVDKRHRDIIDRDAFDVTVGAPKTQTP